MGNEIIEYFKNNLKRKLKRPYCGRYLSLWDNRKWEKKTTNIACIDSNDFLLFLYQTKHDLCCIQDSNGQTLYNAIDKFFYLLFDLETYFNIFISNNIYENRPEILNDINFVQFNCFPNRLYGKYKYLELFQDLVKRTNEWNYWKRLIVISYTKIILTDISYEYAQRHASDFLQELISNIEKVFHKGISS